VLGYRRCASAALEVSGRPSCCRCMGEAPFDLPSPVLPAAAVPVGTLTVRMVDGPTALLELGGLRLLTDPSFSGLHEGAADAPSLVVGVDGRVECEAWEPPSQQAWTKPTSEPRSKAPIPELLTW